MAIKIVCVRSDSFHLLKSFYDWALEQGWKFTTLTIKNEGFGRSMEQENHELFSSRPRELVFQTTGEKEFQFSAGWYAGKFDREVYVLPGDWDKAQVAIDKLFVPTEKPVEKAIEVPLNSGYTARVTKTQVEVGCQVFTFEAIEKLYKAVIKQQ